MKLRDILVKFKTEITIRESEDKERNAGLLSSQHDIYNRAEQAIRKWAIDKLPKEKEVNIIDYSVGDYGFRKGFNQATSQAKQALGNKK